MPLLITEAEHKESRHMTQAVSNQGAKQMTRSKTQNWQIGETVKVGFISGLEVIKKIATPGDYRPDFYVLWQPIQNRFYTFQPHFGLTRCETLEDAMGAF